MTPVNLKKSLKKITFSTCKENNFEKIREFGIHKKTKNNIGESLY